MHDENHLPKKGKQKAEEHTESLKENSFLFLKKIRDFFFMCQLMCFVCWRQDMAMGRRESLKSNRKHVDNLLQVLPMCVHAQLLQSCLPTLCNSLDRRLPGSSVHGIHQQIYGSGLPCAPPEVFLTQGSNLYLLHLLNCRQIHYH